ncbi:MAG: hypothetical protein WD009_11250 [Phycisphaeraceae bacterium]
MNADVDPGLSVVKLGGSLLEMPGLVDRLVDVLPRPGVLVTGGGAAADRVRGVDQQVELDESTSHWLCIHAMAMHARLFAAALAARGVVTRLLADRAACAEACAAGALAVVEPVAWLERDEREGAGIPHRWQFTSDSIAAHVARRVGARRLVLLKSTLPGGAGACGEARGGSGGGGGVVDVDEAARQGVVDPCFPAAATGLECVQLVNLRATPATTCRLRVAVRA